MYRIFFSVKFSMEIRKYIVLEYDYSLDCGWIDVDRCDREDYAWVSKANFWEIALEINKPMEIILYTPL